MLKFKLDAHTSVLDELS